MATRPKFSPSPVITNGSMAGNLTSLPTILNQLSLASYGASWSGSSPVGTVSVQCSNDYSLYANGTVNNAGTWSTITITYGGSPVTTVPVTGNTGSVFIDVGLTAAYAVRLIYTAGTGTGTLQATINGKVS